MKLWIATAALALAGCNGLPGNLEQKATEAPAPMQWWEGWSLEDARLSQPVYPESLLESLPITADDGVVLDAKVLRPVTPEGVKLPVIMQLSPYLPPDINPDTSLVYAELRKHRYVERGYAVAFVSARGFGGSGGCPDYEGERERRDVDAIVDTLAAQPWSSGKVGGMGLSWDGTTLNAAALSGNPHLATIVPVAGITDWYKWSFMQGVPAWIMGYTYNLYAPAAAGLAGGLVSGAQVPPAVKPPCLPSLVDAVLAQGTAALTGTRNGWWDAHNLENFMDAASPELAVLQVQGQRDDGVRPDQLHVWDGAMRARLPNYRLVLGDWTHLWPDTPNMAAAYNPDYEFNKWPLQGWPVILLRWFDHWLKGKDTGIMALPGALIQDDTGNWHGEDGLQPSRTQAQRLYPDGAGGLADAAPMAASLSFIDAGLGVDPRGACVYFAGGLRIGCYPVHLPTAQFFVTAPFTQDTRYSGIARAHLQLTHSMPLGHAGVTLYVINGDTWTALTYGIASYNARDHEHSFELRTPLQAFAQDVELLARDFRIPAGAQLGLAIGAQVGRNPMGLSGNGYFPVPSGGISQIRLGPESWIELPQLQGETVLLPLE